MGINSETGPFAFWLPLSNKNLDFADPHLDHFFQHSLGNVDEKEGVRAVGGHAHKLVGVVVRGNHVDALGWKLMSYSHVKTCVNLLTWLLIGWSLLQCS